VRQEADRATQVVDPRPQPGRTVGKLQALAESCDELVVLADSRSRRVPPTAAVHVFGSGSRERRMPASSARSSVSSPRGRLPCSPHRPRYALLAAPLVRRAGSTPALVHALEAEPHARARRARLAAVLSVVGAPSARLRKVVRSVMGSTPNVSPCRHGSAARLVSSRLGRTRLQKASRRSPAPRRSPSRTRPPRPSSTPRSARTGAAVSLGIAVAAVAYRRCPRYSPVATCSSTKCVRERSTRSYTGGRDLHAGARLQPRLRRPAPAGFASPTTTSTSLPLRCVGLLARIG